MLGAAFISVGKAEGVKITDFKLDGYQEVDTYKKAKAFDNSFLNIIDGKGITLESFNYVVPYDFETSTWGEGFWKHNGKKIVAKGTLQNPDTEEEYDLPGGQGLWCNVGKCASKGAIVIKFPALELK